LIFCVIIKIFNKIKMSSSSETYVKLLYSNYDVKANPPPGRCGSDAASWFGAVGSALGGGVGIAAMAPAAGPVGGPLLIFAGLVVGGFSIGSHALKVAACNKTKT
jgi:hypothetical protein